MTGRILLYIFFSIELVCKLQNRATLYRQINSNTLDKENSICSIRVILYSRCYYFLFFQDQSEAVTPFCAFSPVCLDCGSERCCSRSFISSAQISAGLFLGSRLFTLEREREGQCQNSRAGTISLRLKSLDSTQSPKRDVCCQAIEKHSLSLSHLLNPYETVSPDEWHIVRIEPNFCRHI